MLSDGRLDRSLPRPSGERLARTYEKVLSDLNSLQTTDKILIPQNTLLGLPDELLTQICEEVVRSKTSIATSPYHRTEPLFIQNTGEKYALMRPLQLTQHTRAMALEAMYNVNVFHACVRALISMPGECWLIDHYSQRDSIRHLKLALPFHISWSKDNHTPERRLGGVTITMLKQIPMLYPKLRSLAITVVHDARHPEKEILGDLMASKVQQRANDAFQCLYNVVAAVKSLEFPRRASKKIYVTQRANGCSEEDTERALQVNGGGRRRAKAIKRAVWSMLDYQKSVFEF